MSENETKEKKVKPTYQVVLKNGNDPDTLYMTETVVASNICSAMSKAISLQKSIESKHKIEMKIVGIERVRNGNA